MRVPSNITLIPLPSTSPGKSCPSQAAIGPIGHDQRVLVLSVQIPPLAGSIWNFALTPIAIAFHFQSATESINGDLVNMLLGMTEASR
jgi:hypothetical protein